MSDAELCRIHRRAVFTEVAARARTEEQMDSIGLMALRQQVDDGRQLIVLARYLQELQAHPFAGRFRSAWWRIRAASIR